MLTTITLPHATYGQWLTLKDPLYSIFFSKDVHEKDNLLSDSIMFGRTKCINLNDNLITCISCSLAGVKHELLLSLCVRYQQHLTVCASTVANEQVS